MEGPKKCPSESGVPAPESICAKFSRCAAGEAALQCALCIISLALWIVYSPIYSLKSHCRGSSGAKIFLGLHTYCNEKLFRPKGEEVQSSHTSTHTRTCILPSSLHSFRAHGLSRSQVLSSPQKLILLDFPRLDNVTMP